MATTALNQDTAPPARSPVLSRTLKYLVVTVLVLVVVCAAWASWRSHACLPQLDGTIKVAGLKAPVQVLRDAHGVPHLRAQSMNDLSFAQGYVTAQDRLWQMDLSRRLADGELSEIFGKRTLELDIENRTLGFREASERAVRELDPKALEFITAYTAGVNAFISTHRDHLPIEFALLHYQPRLWRDADSFGISLNMAKRLNTSWRSDLMRERIRSRVTPELYADLFPDRSPLDHPVAEAVSGPIKALHPNADGTLAPDLDSRADADLDPVLTALTCTNAAADLAVGSNNWVVSGAHTRSGKPLLSNDPHLGHSVPSIWYQIHLKAPGLNVSGVSLPGGPLVIIGHNEWIAWGMTNTGPDVQDLYRESFKPGDPNQYLETGQWVDADVRQENIKVRGGSDYQLTVRATRHGPIIRQNGEFGLALKWTALQPHALTVPFLKMNQALNWQEFKEALHSFTGPEQNIVYADVDGNIGYYAPAWVPVRKQGDGSVPVPGDTDNFEWMGYIPFEDLPHAYNPPGGIIATANSRVVPDGYPYSITREWAAPWRTARIFQLLESGENLTVADMLSIDMDTYSLEDEDLARELVAAGTARPPVTADAQYALSLLRSWDGEARLDSAATLVCEASRPQLLKRLLKPKLGDDLSGYHWSLDMTFVDNVIQQQRTRWLPPGDADFNVTLMKSLEEAVRQIPQMVRSRDRAAWRWGETIPLTFHHPLDSIPLMGHLLDLGPFPQKGMATTVKATTPSAGPSMRMVVDFSDLDASVNNLTLGESGQVSSPYYKDQFQAWYNGQSFPMLFTDAAVERGATHRLVLQPEGQP